MNNYSNLAFQFLMQDHGKSTNIAHKQHFLRPSMKNYKNKQNHQGLQISEWNEIK